MNKIFIAILVLVVVLGGYFLLKNPETQTSTTETPLMSENTYNSATSSTQTNDLIPPTIQNTVIYTNAGYAPNTLIIKSGETVTWRNNSSFAMWPASAFHPTHAVYPTTGGCLGSTFDACKGLQPGESWSFKFDKSGNWKYHDHLKPSSFGAVVVE